MEPDGTQVGIDDLNVYGSTLAVQASAINDARGGTPGTAERLRLVRRTLAPEFEDPVTLAVNAAMPLVEEYGRDAFGLLLVATESGVDYAKPLGSYVHHHLGLSERTFHAEVKHACFGATAALQLASAWVREAPARRALVVATDMARRLFGDSGEPAEGAGSVAMAVTADPRVVALEPYRGFAAREIYDVMRPNPVLETIHADLSLAGYLDLLDVAWEGYAAAAGERAFERLDHMAFHTPIVPLVEQAHRAIFDPACGERPAEHFARRVAPSLAYCRELGNLYSGCLYAALAGLVDTAPNLRTDGVVGLYSYGAGSCASYFSAKLHPEARARLARHHIAAHLAARRVVDVPTYERIVLDNERALTESSFRPSRDRVPGHYEAAYRGRRRLVLEEVRSYYRSYAWS